MDIIRVRLDPQYHLLYKAQAACHNLPLGTYLRQRLEEQDRIYERFNALEERLSHLEKGVQQIVDQKPESLSSERDPLLYEIALLLRSTVNPGELLKIGSELKRQGIPIWKGTPEPSL